MRLTQEAGCNWSKLSAFHKLHAIDSQSHVTFELNYGSESDVLFEDEAMSTCPLEVASRVCECVSERGNWMR